MNKILYKIRRFLAELWDAIDPVGKVAIIGFFILIFVVLPLSVSSQMVALPNPNIPQVTWITEFDGCEYIVWQNSHWSPSYVVREMTHKGNCKYCQQRLEELIKKWR